MNMLNLFCHRKPDRSFHFLGYKFPVCSRCTGFYIAIFSYYLYAYFFYVRYTISLIIISSILLVPAFFDGTYQIISDYESNNYLRLLTGLLGGLGLAIILKYLKYCIYLWW